MDSLAMITASNPFSDYMNPVKPTYDSTNPPPLSFLTAEQLSSISQNNISSEAPALGSEPQAYASEDSIVDQQHAMTNNKFENRDLLDYFTTPKQREMIKSDQTATPSEALKQILQSAYHAENDENFQAADDSSPSSHLPHRSDPASLFAFPTIQPPLNPNQSPDYEFKTPHEQPSPTPSNPSTGEPFQLPFNYGVPDPFPSIHHHHQGNNWSSNAVLNLYTDGMRMPPLSFSSVQTHFLPSNLINNCSTRSPESTVPSSYNSSATNSPLSNSLQLSTTTNDFFITPEHNYHHHLGIGASCGLGFNPPSFDFFGSQPNNPFPSSSSSGQHQYMRNSSLSSHQIKPKNQSGITKWFICPKCGKRHSRQSNLHAHLRDTHSDQKKVLCDVVGCNKAYKRVSECRRHKKDMHGIPLPSELAGKTRRPRRIIPRPEY